MRARRSVLIFVAVLGGTLAVAGCGGDGGTADPDAPGGSPGVVVPNVPTPPVADPGVFDGCDLLTREEAIAAAGNPLHEGQMFGVVCIWEQEDLEEPSHLQLSIAFLPVPPGAALTAEQLCLQGAAVMDNPEPGSGIGNSSYWEFQQGGLSNNGTLLVCLDQGTISAAAIGGRPESELRQVATSIANTALGRLQPS